MGICGAIIGAVISEKPGLFLGFFLGLLTAEVFKLKSRITQLEHYRNATFKKPFDEKRKESSVDKKQEEIIEPAKQSNDFVQDDDFKKNGTSCDDTHPLHEPFGFVSQYFDKCTQYLKTFFSTGNVVLKIGMIILFFGVGFLLKYTAQNNLIPIELRIILVAISGLTILFIGYRLRKNRHLYALVMQGGGIGILYLTVFAATKPYNLLPYSLCFVLMILLVSLSGALAVLQNAKSLAVFGIIGGFFAPILISKGGQSHVMLFSYYALLNMGIFGIAWFKSWRELNLIGFIFTFIISALWGSKYYKAYYFSSTEPFLILYFIFYVAISILFAHRQPPKLKGYVDGSLVFGVPFVCFGLQSSLVHNFAYGLAISALCAGIFYIICASFLWKKNIAEMRLLTEAFLALAVLFGSLAIPLALNGKWTAAAWAFEGACLIWIGLRQNRLSARLFGLLLQFGAGISFFADFTPHVKYIPVFNGFYLDFLIISIAGLFSCYYLSNNLSKIKKWETKFPVFLLVWGILWWFAGGLHEIDIHVAAKNELKGYLVFWGISSLFMVGLSKRYKWELICYPAISLLPAMILLSLADFDHNGSEHLFHNWGFFAWALVFTIQYYLLWCFEKKWPEKLVFAWHITTLYLLIFILSRETYWFAGWLINSSYVWQFICIGLIPGFFLLFLVYWGEKLKWPVCRFSKLYTSTGAKFIAFYLLLFNVIANFNHGNCDLLLYIPLLNPLELSQVFIIVILFLWAWKNRDNTDLLPDLLPEKKPFFFIIYILAISTFILLNAIVARAVHNFANISFTFFRLHNSVIFQSAISILWSLSAMALSHCAAKIKNRQVWFAGSVILTFVVLKLFIVDLSGSGTVARIVSFLAVGMLMLLIGYLSPLPPKSKEKV